LSDGKYQNEIYITHLELRKEDLAVIVTELRVLMIGIQKTRVEYDAGFEEIRKIEHNGCNVYMAVKGSRDSQWVIPCPDVDSAQWLFKVIESAYLEHLQLFRPFE
jgi:vacuolar protein sorting-associated protein 13A/C